MHNHPWNVRLLTGALLCVLLAGCEFSADLDPDVVDRYERAMIGRGIQPATPRDVSEARLPADSPDLLGGLQVARDPNSTAVLLPLSLDEGIRRALAANLDVQVVQFDPFISRQQMIQAEAEFDAIVFGSLSKTKTDDRIEPIFGAGQIGQTKVRAFQAGVRKKTTWGTNVELSYSLQRTWDDATFRAVSTRYEPAIELQISQPLLRNGWPEFNLARVRITRINHQIDIATFRQNVEETITDVINAYWQLYQARQEVVIQRALTEETRVTNEIAQLRKDARPNVEKKQTEAAVQQREVELIRLEKAALDAQDQLARLLGIAQARTQKQLLIVPTTPPVIVPAEIHPVDQLIAALRYSPVLQQARLAIGLSNINVQVAENQLLPRLDLNYSAELTGLAHNSHEAHENMGTLDYLGYSIGLEFEYPLGNRNARAELRRRRLERLKAITQLQNTADQLAAVVNERVRAVATAYDVWLAQKATIDTLKDLVMGSESLVREKSMTLSNLQLLLDSQARLAAARRGLIQAEVEYNVALTELDRTTGTILTKYGVDLALPEPLDRRDWLDAEMPPYTPEPDDPNFLNQPPEPMPGAEIREIPGTDLDQQPLDPDDPNAPAEPDDADLLPMPEIDQPAQPDRHGDALQDGPDTDAPEADRPEATVPDEDMTAPDQPDEDPDDLSPAETAPDETTPAAPGEPDDDTGATGPTRPPVDPIVWPDEYE